MNTNDVGNASLVAGISTGLMTTIANNATAITVICTIVFGVIYASCAIWNAFSNHKRNKVTERATVDKMFKDAEGNEEVLSILKKHFRKNQ